MAAIVIALFKRFTGWIVAAVSITIAVFVALWFAHSVGKSRAQAAAEKAEASREIEAVKNTAAKELQTLKGANDVKNDVNKLDNGDVVDQLRSKWQRD